MTKRKSPSRQTSEPIASAAVASDSRKQKRQRGPSPAKPPEWHGPSPSAIRETIESVVIAFVLAFLVRTFEAEAFVIPTGSMAPTLMGRHKDLACPKCGYEFQVSASEEVDPEGVEKGPLFRVVGCTCPMCRFPMDISDGKKYPSFKGDRILVDKLVYQFREPRPWDVAVFRYPGGADINYIKRLVGMPQETIRIQQGDIYVKGEGETEFHIRHKGPEKLLAMLQPVFDNDLMPKIMEYGFPVRWRPWPSPEGSSAGAWQPAADYRSYETSGGAAAEAWLRYENRVPSAQNWQDVQRNGRLKEGETVALQLISDFSGYNAGRDAMSALSPNRAAEPQGLGLHWVGDLAVQCTLEVKSDEGQALFELVKGGRRFQCQIDIGSGEATLAIDGETPLNIDGQAYSFPPPKQTAVRGRGKHRIMFANCDEELLLWVDGSLVYSDGETRYPPLGNTLPEKTDLAPVAVGSRGAALEVSALKVLRDIYYIAAEVTRKNDPRSGSYKLEEPPLTEQILADPRKWPGAFDPDYCVEFVLEADQFLALGDNSAKSKDSRMWGEDGLNYFVKRELLIGKAFYIYWPHSWDRPFPFFPNFRRMHFVR